MHIYALVEAAIPIFDVDKPLIQNIGSFVAASCPQSPLTTLLDNGAQAAIVYMLVLEMQS